MKLALCQMDISWLNFKENLDRIKKYTNAAEAAKADVVIFPEMALSGFCMDEVAASLKLDSPEIKELLLMTRSLKVMVMVGAAIKIGTDHYNSFLIIRNGEILTSYSKINLFKISNEHEHYKPGNNLLLIDYMGVTIAPFVCFDTRFPALWSLGTKQGAELFIVIASWPAAQQQQWRTLLSARAIDTQAYVIGVNRIGVGDGIEYSGDSNVFTPGGKALLPFNAEERLSYIEIDGSYVKKIRERFPVLSEQHGKQPDTSCTRLSIK